MILVLDVIGPYECPECADLGRPGRDGRCTSCRAWQDHGVLPTSLPSCHLAVAELAEMAWRDRDEVGDASLRELTDHLVTLEGRRAARPRLV